MTNDLVQALEEATAHLDAFGRPWCLVGGLAVGVRVEPRFTRDLDLAISVADDAQAESLVLRLRSSGYEVLAMLEQNATGRLATG